VAFRAPLGERRGGVQVFDPPGPSELVHIGRAAIYRTSTSAIQR
jgi:hypothetical protein